MKSKRALLISCEHGGNAIPPKYKHLFAKAHTILKTHRGFDIGALQLFQVLCELPHDFSISNEVTRLLVDFNRSLHRKTLFSEFTIQLSASEKQTILNEYYHPYRAEFAEALSSIIKENKSVLHISVHSFTPIYNSIERNADIGILYHPDRPYEKQFAKLFKAELKTALPNLKIRFNYPYLGKPDGHVAPHRKIYDDAQYGGIELELNQKHAHNCQICSGIKLALATVLEIL